MLLSLLPVAMMLAQPVETALEGYWRNPSGSVIISIAPCGEAMCGRVQWASDKALADARKNGTDPLIGVELLSDFVPKGENRWKGRLFVPDLKRTSKAEVRQLGPDQVKVKGCAAGRLVCKSQVWTRSQAE
jgi:uncharacterized protein (DUF2147 family)